MLFRNRHLIFGGSCILGAVLCITGWAEDAASTQARNLFLKGRYTEALAASEATAKDAPLGTHLLQHEIYLATGEREKAFVAMKAASGLAPSAQDVLQIEAAWWLAARDFTQTQAALDQLLRQHADDAIAHWLQVECWLQAGRFAEARAALPWFAAQAPEKMTVDIPTALAFARGLTEHARWSQESKWFNVAVNDVLGAAAKQHPADWRVPALRARLFAEKHNEPAAVDALNLALAANASAPELHVLRAELALAKFDVPAAQRAAEQARRTNPQLLELAYVDADGCFAELRPERAAEILETARKHWGDRPELLGRLSAAYRASHQAPHLQQTQKRIQSLGPAAVWAYGTEGEACELMRRIEQARTAYEQAFALAPEFPGVRFRLASQRLRLNENRDVAELLAAAFQEDPFNVRLKNTLAVLDVLQTYATLETEHFIIRFDRGRDELLAKYMAEYLETEVYPDLSTRFGFQPADKSVIEIYNRTKNTSGHGWFSARMIGLPSLHTIGACSGRIVALASPTDMPRPYNWARVLRHEFVHRLNLEQTHFQVPHWVTEGLAVEAEERPRPSDWTRLITQRQREHKLFTLADINFGFIRPASSRDWTLAYAQAELYIEFLRAKYGVNSTAKLLQALADNCTTSEAIERATGIPLTEFETGYREYLDKQIAQWNLASAVTVDDPAPLQAAFNRSPDNRDLQAELAAAYLARGELVLARRHAAEAFSNSDQQQTAAYVLATLALNSGNPAEAERIAQSAIQIAKPHPDLLLLLATRKLAAKQFPLAQKLLTLGRQQFPSLDSWEEQLVKLYTLQRDSQKLRSVMEALALRREDDSALPAKLMELAWLANDAIATERWAMATLRIDVNHAVAHGYRGLALASLKRNGESLAEFAAAEKHDKLLPEWKVAYARVSLATGNQEQAKRLVEELITSSPDLPGLVELAREIEK